MPQKDLKLDKLYCEGPIALEIFQGAKIGKEVEVTNLLLETFIRSRSYG